MEKLKELAEGLKKFAEKEAQAEKAKGSREKRNNLQRTNNSPYVG